MRSLAQEVAAERIRVNAIAPGAIRTPINKSAWETAKAARRLLTLIPYGRIGEPSPQPQCSSQAMIRTMSSVRPSLSMAE